MSTDRYGTTEKGEEKRLHTAATGVARYGPVWWSLDGICEEKKKHTDTFDLGQTGPK